MAPPIVECVPNFSEGRDRAVIDAIARAISSVKGVALLGVEPGADANRSVYTFAGAPEAAAEAAVASAKAAYGLIDMAKHKGVHPRMGALDVCPFVPVSGMDMAGCVGLSKLAAERIARELGVPVYLYEASASRPERKSLAYLRSGGYEALPAKLAAGDWVPDYGPSVFVPSWGATVGGARGFLIAFNINLNARVEALAKEIAMRVRESGRVVKDPSGGPLKGEEGRTVRIPGRLKAVRAIGWYIEAYGCAQVSVNILDYAASPLHLVFETVREEAEALGLRVTGSELVGLVPLEAMLVAGRHFSADAGKGTGLVRPDEEALVGADEQALIRAAVASMGLDSVLPFAGEEKIVEYALASKGSALG
jgi:glutamate formiminotransferase / formiminotetrahydrofolate cyclodeaminase